VRAENLEMNNRRNVKAATFVCAVILAFALAACSGRQPTNAPATTASLTASKGAEVMRAQCLACHGMDMIEQQRLAKAGWTREVEKMVRWGANVSDADKEPLVEYLAVSYGPRPLAPQSPAPSPPAQTSIARGEAVFKGKCLACHGPELSEQQRLARAGWTREVEKMMRWGAAVEEAEKEPLIDYLAHNYGPHRAAKGKQP
jgi:mono/diheme cytochrome c family protein